MKTLIIGAGGLGGYFGGRLLEIGRDVTFLVRPRRAEQLRVNGLVVKSPKGDIHIPDPPRLLANELPGRGFDLIILSCKAYDLDAAIDDLAPAVGQDTAILPLLNGMRHMDALDARFGLERVLGGRCGIPATIDPDGTVRQLAPIHEIIFGERDGTLSARVGKVAELMQGTNFDSRASDTIVQDMWEKWVALASLGASNCLFRGTVGDIMAGGGGDTVRAILAEADAIAAAGGHAMRPQVATETAAFLTNASSVLAASMMRDLENGYRVEADHIVGDLIARAGDLKVPNLSLAYKVLKTYEARRAREAKA